MSLGLSHLPCESYSNSLPQWKDFRNRSGAVEGRVEHWFADLQGTKAHWQMGWNKIKVQRRLSTKGFSSSEGNNEPLWKGPVCINKCHLIHARLQTYQVLVGGKQNAWHTFGSVEEMIALLSAKLGTHLGPLEVGLWEAQKSQADFNMHAYPWDLEGNYCHLSWVGFPTNITRCYYAWELGQLLGQKIACLLTSSTAYCERGGIRRQCWVPLNQIEIVALVCQREREATSSTRGPGKESK